MRSSELSVLPRNTKPLVIADRIPRFTADPDPTFITGRLRFVERVQAVDALGNERRIFINGAGREDMVQLENNAPPELKR